MTKLHFNWKDVFSALRLGFSAKKLWVMGQGLVMGFGGYVLLSYVALLIKGTSLPEIWSTYRLSVIPSYLPWYSWIIWGIGVAWFVFMVLIAGITVSKLTYEQLKGDEFFEIKEAWKLGWKRAGSLVASPGLLAAFIAILVIAGLILSLIGKIPYFGELFVGIMAIPAFATALFLVYLLVTLFFTFTLAPVIIGTTNSDAFDTLFEIFSCLNNQTARLIFWQFILLVLSGVGTFIFGFFTVKAVNIATLVVGSFMGTKLTDILGNGASLFALTFPAWLPPSIEMGITWIVNALGIGIFLNPPSFIPLGWGKDIAAGLIGISLYAAIFLVLSYGGTIWYGGNTAVYIVLVKKKDDRNLLEVKEEVKVPEKIEAKPEEPEKEKAPPKKVRKKPAKKSKPKE